MTPGAQAQRGAPRRFPSHPALRPGERHRGCHPAIMPVCCSVRSAGACEGGWCGGLTPPCQIALGRRTRWVSTDGAWYPGAELRAQATRWEHATAGPRGHFPRQGRHELCVRQTRISGPAQYLPSSGTPGKSLSTLGLSLPLRKMGLIVL